MRILIAAGLMLAPGPLIRAVRAGGTGTGSSQYDNAGRYFFVGANMNF